MPRDLLEQYLSMMDPSCAQKVDGEITRHCAYSLPAVAYTLGRRNWPSLKNLYTTLAADVQVSRSDPIWQRIGQNLSKSIRLINIESFVFGYSSHVNKYS